MLLPNKRLKLAGASKQCRIPFVCQESIGSQISLRCARGPRARSLSAVR